MKHVTASDLPAIYRDPIREEGADLETVGTAGIFMQGSTGFDVTATRFLVREASAR